MADATPARGQKPGDVVASPGQPVADPSAMTTSAPQQPAANAEAPSAVAASPKPKGTGTTAASRRGFAGQQLQQQPQAAPVEVVDPDVVHRNTIVASTFANLELQNAQTTLRQYTQLYDGAVAENQRLADLLKERDRDAMQVVDYLRTQLEENEAKVRETNLRFERAEEDFNARHRSEVQRLKDDINDRDDTIAKLRGQLAEAHDKLDELAHFQQDKQQLEMQISRLKEGERDLVLAHEKEMTKVKFASLEEKVKLRAVEKAMTSKFDGEVNERAMQLVDTKTQQIRESNVALIKQKAALERDVQHLTVSVRASTEGMEAAKREADLARESHAEYARQGCKLTRVARDATKRVRELENRCNELTRELQTQQLEAVSKREAAVTALKADLRFAREAGGSLKQQLQQMRDMTAQVLAQRSDLENFFYDALEFTRGQQGKCASGGDSRAVGASLDTAMSPRVAAGYRGDLDARTSVKAHMHTTAATTKPATMTQALTPRGDGTFLAKEGLEGIGPRRGLTSSTAVSPRQSPRSRGSRPSTRGTLPHVATATPLSRPGRSGTDDGGAAKEPAADPDVESESVTEAPPPAPAGSFAGLSWADKEKLIAALLHHLNRSFYNAPPPPPPLQQSMAAGSSYDPDVLTLHEQQQQQQQQREEEQASAPLSLEDYRRPPRHTVGTPGGRGSRPTTRDGRPPLPVQRPDDEDGDAVAEWGRPGPSTARPPLPGSAGGSRAGPGTPASAVAFPSSAPSSARGVRPPQPPPTATGGQRIQRQPSSSTPNSGAPVSVTKSALRRSAPSSARSSAGSRRATFATGNSGTDSGAHHDTPEQDASEVADPVVE